MKSSPLRVLGAAISVLFLGAPACSSSSSAAIPVDAGHPDTAPPVCKDSYCLAGNQCLPDQNGLVECRLPCTGQSGCPWDYTCSQVTSPSGATNDFCTADTAVSPATGLAYVEKPGVWGAACNPANGVDNNPDCDWGQGFRCYAQSPTDGNAFCTQIYCKTDADCRGGWGCATVNLAPNAESGNRSTGQTYTVCKPREQCAECQSDLDCASPVGLPEHCIADKNGGHYCATECSTNGNCTLDAHCLTLDQSAYCKKGDSSCVCAQIAQECTGDGLLCSPCLSDADCKAGGGLCLLADYSTEHFCGVPSTIPCTYDNGTPVFKCPKTDESPGGTKAMAAANISCLTAPDGVEDPANQCVGLVNFGAGVQVLGCWSVHPQ